MQYEEEEDYHVDRKALEGNAEGESLVICYGDVADLLTQGKIYAEEGSVVDGQGEE
jgi:hypothetical protein